ncbi:MAG: helix-turn-helix transcriptional regulator [Clostridia bacterium]|nr:helix-turn-helix transcriptional regulator [Clostridia bacterium]
MASSGKETDREALLVGLRIRDVRIQYGYSLEQFAERLEVSVSHLSNIECGRKKPPLALLVRLATEFDASLDYLVLGRQDKSSGGFLVFRSDEELLKTFAIAPKGARA